MGLNRALHSRSGVKRTSEEIINNKLIREREDAAGSFGTHLEALRNGNNYRSKKRDRKEREKYSQRQYKGCKQHQE